MKAAILLSVLLGWLTHADDGIEFNHRDANITEVISDYAEASRQSFVIDPAVNGKVTILNPKRVSIREAFGQLSSALAVNGLAISKQGDTMIVSRARNTQRSYIDASTTLPELKPERMALWLVTLKNIRAESAVTRKMPISRDGEIVSFRQKNMLLISDYTSNLHKIAKVIAEIDKR